jgi:hypothetical protein
VWSNDFFELFIFERCRKDYLDVNKQAREDSWTWRESTKTDCKQRCKEDGGRKRPDEGDVITHWKGAEPQNKWQRRRKRRV